MARQKSVFEKMSNSIKAGAAAVVDVAQAALTASSDLPEGGGYKPVKKQRWVQEIEATGAKKSPKKKSKKKSAKEVTKNAVKKAVKKTARKSKKKRF